MMLVLFPGNLRGLQLATMQGLWKNSALMMLTLSHENL